MILPKDPGDDPEQESAPERPALHLHLRMPQGERSRRLPSRLARILGLHLYSEVLLSQRARIEMNFAAIILVVVSLFELIAWSFLFNAIFNSDILYHGAGTIPAVLMASLFAAAVFWFERQFLTYDEARRDKAKRAAWIRLAFILASAFVTAQPLELLFFRLPIQNRVHEERIREEAVKKLSALKEWAQRGQGYYSQQLQQERQAYNNLVTQIQGEKNRLNELGNGLVSSARDQGRWGKEAALLGNSSGTSLPAGQDPKKEREEFVKAAGNQQAALSQAKEIRQQIKVAQDAIGSLQDQIDTKQKNVKNLIELQRWNEQQNDNRLRDWIDLLQKSKPRDIVTERWKSPKGEPQAGGISPWDGSFEPYKDQDYDFFEQIHVVWNLAFGQSPRWLNGTPEIDQLLNSQYGFGSLGQGESGSKPHLLAAITVCHLIALFIPLLVLTIKTFLMPQELRSYYSSRHQAAAGDRDAWLAMIVEEKVKEEGRLAAERGLGPEEKR